MDFNILGERILSERLMQRLTIEQLAERINKSSNFLGQIERGERKLSITTLLDIANALGTTIDSLMADNLKTKDDYLTREINTLLFHTDDAGKKFIIDMIKRYAYYHNDKF